MSLRNELEQRGSWLFRYRSYLPVVLIPFFVPSFVKFTYLGHSHSLNECWQLFCLAISALGFVIRVVTIGHAPMGTSGRNTGTQVAMTLSRTGFYSVVRHPLYLGNYFILLGFALWPHVWWLPVLTTCIYALYYERIMLAEEAYLRQRFGEIFDKWSQEVPAFIPRFHGWMPSPISFSWRTAVQRERHAFFLIFLVFFLSDCIGDSIVDNTLHLSYFWFLAFLASLVIFAVLHVLKRNTKLLQVDGR